MNSKTNIVRAILLDASECDRPEADHPATIEICADDLQRILERHITEPAQCLLQIAEPATAGTAVRAFRDYLGVHDGIKLGGQAMDDMALDLARIALDFKHLVEPQHPDDAAVDALAVLMKAKLAKQRAKGYGGWNDKIQCTQQRLSTFLRTHVDKGDPVDVANFCAMLSARGEGIAAAPQAVQPFGYVNTHTGQFFADVEPSRKNNEGHWRTVYSQPAPQAVQPAVPGGLDKREDWIGLERPGTQELIDVMHTRGAFSMPIKDREPIMRCIAKDALAEVTRLKALLASTQPAAQAVPVLYVSKGQLDSHRDPDGVDTDGAGRYLPARKTPKGNFTAPLYEHPAPAAQGMDAQDAARYRWLRNESWACYNFAKKKPEVALVAVVRDGAGNIKLVLAEDAMDDAVDAAIAAQAKQGGA